MALHHAFAGNGESGQGLAQVVQDGKNRIIDVPESKEGFFWNCLGVWL